MSFYEEQAWDSYDVAMDEGYRFCYGRRRKSRSANLYVPYERYVAQFYRDITYVECLHTTKKARLFELNDPISGKQLVVWIPKTIIKAYKENVITVHSYTYTKIIEAKLEQYASIPLWK